MKYQEFATQNFIGLKSIQRELIRTGFTFREQKITTGEIIYKFLYFIKEIITYIQKDY